MPLARAAALDVRISALLDAERHLFAVEALVREVHERAERIAADADWRSPAATRFHDAVVAWRAGLNRLGNDIAQARAELRHARYLIAAEIAAPIP